ncbi:MAG: hypothetical protein HQL29_06325, partial [Candidatus Omnitrophica bacterium]|nr:hypothetical protein [Candidatus Omnitrophota bacterium]
MVRDKKKIFNLISASLTRKSVRVVLLEKDGASFDDLLKKLPSIDPYNIMPDFAKTIISGSSGTTGGTYTEGSTTVTIDPNTGNYTVTENGATWEGEVSKFKGDSKTITFSLDITGAYNTLHELLGRIGERLSPDKSKKWFKVLADMRASNVLIFPAISDTVVKDNTGKVVFSERGFFLDGSVNYSVMPTLFEGEDVASVEVRLIPQDSWLPQATNTSAAVESDFNDDMQGHPDKKKMDLTVGQEAWAIGEVIARQGIYLGIALGRTSVVGIDPMSGVANILTQQGGKPVVDIAFEAPRQWRTLQAMHDQLSPSDVTLEKPLSLVDASNRTYVAAANMFGIEQSSILTNVAVKASVNVRGMVINEHENWCSRISNTLDALGTRDDYTNKLQKVYMEVYKEKMSPEQVESMLTRQDILMDMLGGGQLSVNEIGFVMASVHRGEKDTDFALSILDLFKKDDKYATQIKTYEYGVYNVSIMGDIYGGKKYLTYNTTDGSFSITEPKYTRVNGEIKVIGYLERTIYPAGKEYPDGGKKTVFSLPDNSEIHVYTDASKTFKEGSGKGEIARHYNIITRSDKELPTYSAPMGIMRSIGHRLAGPFRSIWNVGKYSAGKVGEWINGDKTSVAYQNKQSFWQYNTESGKKSVVGENQITAVITQKNSEGKKIEILADTYYGQLDYVGGVATNVGYAITYTNEAVSYNGMGMYTGIQSSVDKNGNYVMGNIQGKWTDVPIDTKQDGTVQYRREFDSKIWGNDSEHYDRDITSVSVNGTNALVITNIPEEFLPNLAPSWTNSWSGKTRIIKTTRNKNNEIDSEELEISRVTDLGPDPIVTFIFRGGIKDGEQKVDVSIGRNKDTATSGKVTVNVETDKDGKKQYTLTGFEAEEFYQTIGIKDLYKQLKQKAWINKTGDSYALNIPGIKDVVIAPNDVFQVIDKKDGTRAYSIKSLNNEEKVIISNYTNDEGEKMFSVRVTEEGKEIKDSTAYHYTGTFDPKAKEFGGTYNSQNRNR